jgi:hypothetical protein
MGLWHCGSVELTSKPQPFPDLHCRFHFIQRKEMQARGPAVKEVLTLFDGKVYPGISGCLFIIAQGLKNFMNLLCILITRHSW